MLPQMSSREVPVFLVRF